jgi:hypothetical protein
MNQTADGPEQAISQGTDSPGPAIAPHLRKRRSFIRPLVAVAACIVALTLYASVQIRRDELNRDLVSAVANGDVEAVQELLQQGANANALLPRTPSGGLWNLLREMFGPRTTNDDSVLTMAMNSRDGFRDVVDTFRKTWRGGPTDVDLPALVSCADRFDRIVALLKAAGARQ